VRSNGTCDPQRILIVNPFGIGDVLFSTPLIRAIRRTFPAASLAYLCNRRTQEILRRNPHLDELFIYEKDELVRLLKSRRIVAILRVLRLLNQIRRRRFDIVIDLSLGERYSFLLAALGVRRRIGFDFRRRGRFLTHRIAIEGYAQRHVVTYYATLLSRIGIRLLDETFELNLLPQDREDVGRWVQALGLRKGQRVIGLVPAGGISWGLQANFRRWSKEGFIAVGRVLSEQYDATVFVFGEPQDDEICQDIACAIGPRAVDLSGRTSMGQFVGLIGCCDLVISNDGGPVHIAASQRIPTVSIFGPVDPEVYGPHPKTGEHRTVYNAQLPCRPCYHQFKLPPCPYERACLRTIEPEEVLDVCRRLLEQRQESPSPVVAGTRAVAGVEELVP